MREIEDSDFILEAFSRKVIARRNLRSLEGKSTKTEKTVPSEGEEEDKPPFKPSNH